MANAEMLEMQRAFDDALVQLSKAFVECCARCNLPAQIALAVLVSSSLEFAAHLARENASRAAFLAAAAVSFDGAPDHRTLQ